jgi:tetraacyldisaccharide 4'-kinase
MNLNPLAGLYRAAIAIRNMLYDRGVFGSRRLQRPVVSVGNLSTGGSGKTPFVIALGELLKERAIRFDVLSRGYGRKTRGVRIVDPNGSVAEFGDEPLLIARRLGVPVIVGESRYAAGVLAEQKFESQLHILDDGFQHRSLARDFDIVLMTDRDFTDGLLPMGRLREPLSALARAHAIVLPQDSAQGAFSVHDLAIENLRRQGKLIWRAQREIVVPPNLVSPIVFCGIARPQQFFAQIRGAGIVPAAEIVFRDHHAYDLDDIQALLSTRRDRVGVGFVTTEKDAINLGSERHCLDPLAIAELILTLGDSSEILDGILSKIIFPK